MRSFRLFQTKLATDQQDESVCIWKLPRIYLNSTVSMMYANSMEPRSACNKWKITF